ncbi:MAG: hypothetical protein ACR2O6_05775, partial [Ilumatobacteraceae bacterium]
LDTRPGAATIDGAFAGIGLRPAGSTLQLDVAGRAGLPADSSSVVLNVTATLPGAWGYLTVNPSGTARPNTSNLNYAAGQTIANTVVTAVGADGLVSIYTSASTHLIVDVAGHLPVATFEPLPAPARILDTRLGTATVDGEHAGIGLRCASSSVQLNVDGRAGLPADASSVVLNVTAVDALAWGFVTEFPTGSGRPNASNLNYDAGTTIANTVVARLGAGGDVCVYTYGATHLIVDLIGHLPGPPPPPAGPTCPPMRYGSPRSLGSGVTVADINNAGIVVGTDWHGSAADSDAIWWPTLGGGPQLVPGVAADTRQSVMIAVNDRDEVLVETYSDTRGVELFVIDLPSGHSVLLPDLDAIPELDGIDVSSPFPVALNDRGEAVLNLVQDEHTLDAVIAVWNSKTGAIETHDDLLDVGWAYDINDRGHVVGATFGDDGYIDSFYWEIDTSDVHWLDLGSFPMGWAYGLNDRGQVVGAVEDGLGGRPATIWPSRDAAPVLIPGSSPAARDINEAGLVRGIFAQPDTWWAAHGIWDSVSGEWLEFPVQREYPIHAMNDVGQLVGLMGDEQPALWHPL